MYHPTIAERKTMISKLPPAPEGKVWKRLTEGKMKAGDHLFIESGGIVHIGEIRIGAPFDGAPVSELENYQSVWRLVAARKRLAKTIYYCPSEDHPVGGDTNRWTAKLSGYADHIYRPNGSYESNGSKESFGWAKGARGNIESGMWKTISRTEFLSRIKGYGLNEDGTKIVPPPRVRFFKHVDGFGGPLLFVALRPDETHYFIYKDREVVEAEDKYWTKARCEETVKGGSWVEVFQPEVDAALAPKPQPKTELERLKEALTAANARISKLEAKIASAREVLS